MSVHPIVQRLYTIEGTSLRWNFFPWAGDANIYFADGSKRRTILYGGAYEVFMQFMQSCLVEYSDEEYIVRVKNATVQLELCGILTSLDNDNVGSQHEEEPFASIVSILDRTASDGGFVPERGDRVRDPNYSL